MLHCYSKKCFTGIIIILMLILAKSSYAAIQKDTTAKKATNPPGLITGKVVDEDNRALKGVKIVINGRGDSLKTDLAGHFSVIAKTGDKLEFTYPNHYVNDVTINNAADTLSVRLLDHYLKSPETIDVLYGTINKANELGSISTIYNNQITTTPGPTYIYALPGQLAGLYTQQTSGFTSAQNVAILQHFLTSTAVNYAPAHNIIPSDNTEFTLTSRGQFVTTVIDGIQQNIAAIDPSSIESISILKDALSTILLGINSSKPVLLITTKKPDLGDPRITFTTEAGVQQSLGLPSDPLPAYQWAYLYNEALQNDGKPAFYTNADIEAYRNHTDPYGHPDVNWSKLLLKTYSPLITDKLNVSGGTETARYYVSLGYLDQGGIFNEAPGLDYSTNNNISRYTLNSNISVDVTKNLNVDLQMYGRVQQMFEPGSGYASILTNIFTTPNNAYPVYNPDGSFGGSSTISNFTNNLLSQAQYSGYTQTNIKDVLVNLDLNYKLNGVTQGLSFKAKGNLAIESQVYITRNQQNNAYGYAIVDSAVKLSPVGTTTPLTNVFATELSARYSFAQAALNYDRQFGKNRFGGQLLYDTKSSVVSYDLASVTTDKALKVNYGYDDKYLFEGAINNSSYNRYTPGHQSGWFYAAGLGWQMGKEDFMKNIKWIDSWKWRLTYGKTGDNSNAGYYTYKQTFTSGGGYPQGLNYGSGSGYQEVTPIADPSLSWANADKLDFGTDISLLHDHLQIEADYYHEKYYNLVTTRGATIELLGTTYPQENIGINLYKGGELTLTYKNNIDNFNYFITGNGSLVSSKVLYFDEQPPKYPWNAHTGLPVTAIYGYKNVGFYTVDDVAKHVATIAGYSAQPGDLKYADLNGDGVIDQYDQTAIGGLKPLVFYGGTIGFNYKGLSFSMILQGVFNRQVSVDNSYDAPFQGLGSLGTGASGQAYANAVGRWTPETASTATLPRLSIVQDEANGNNVQMSSFYVKSGDYFRVKNAELGYELPLRWAKSLRLSGIRVFVNGENLFTVAGYRGYPGYDPEVNTVGAYPIQRVINAGLTVKL